MWILLLTACEPPPASSPPPSVESDTDTDTDTDTDSDTDTDTDTDADTDTEIELPEPWVVVQGGGFLLGSPSPAPVFNETPQIAVSIQTFAMMRHEVLATDYAACVADGACAPAPTGGNCVADDAENLPRNCIDWFSARDVCAWLGGRLPTEAEWEYVASSRGQDVTYPWGEEEPDCDRANVVQPNGANWCPGGIWEVCTHPDGDTPLGFCEMAGNMIEWVEDWFIDSYATHPTDGTAQTDASSGFRSMRGGGVGSGVPVRVKYRTYHPPDFYYGGQGTRCAMDL